jgi:hypothetical protein
LAIAAGLCCLTVAAPCLAAPASSTAAPPDDSTTTTLAGDETGGGAPAPASVPSAPLVLLPEGCTPPPIAAVVFVGRVVTKDFRTARYRIEHVRAGDAEPYSLGGLIDVRYGNDVDYLDVDGEYLVGAAPEGPELVLSSKVREDKPLLGGNAVVGLTEQAADCPPFEDPVRTLHPDGTEIGTSVLKGLKDDKKGIVLAFAKPIGAVLAIVLGLVLIRWLVAAYIVAIRTAAEVSQGTTARTRPPQNPTS